MASMNRVAAGDAGERDRDSDREGARESARDSCVLVRRGGVVESAHRVHAAIADGRGRLVAWAGDPDRVTFFRSSAKPFQMMPLVEDGVVERYGLTDRHLAVCCASHNGEAGHLDLVRELLARGGFDESALECGPHVPLGEAAAEGLRSAGIAPAPIHNNCSGKHAGMLLLARHHGWSPGGYIHPDHPVQKRMLAEVARWTGLPGREIETGTDGCGVVCFAVSVRRMAAAFAGLAESVEPRGQPGPATIVRAMTSCPFEVAGTDRLCTDLMRRAGGEVLVKLGADGVYGGAWLNRGWGFALKIEDGNRRALEAALIATLRQVGALSEEDVEHLDRYARPTVMNTLGNPVGSVESVLELISHDG